MRARDYFTEKDYNCSESIVHGMNDRYSLGLSEQEMFLVSAFGGGMGCGEACGALCGCVAVLGRMAVKTRAHVTPDFAKLCSEFVDRFKKSFSGINCRDIKPIHFKPECKCADLVDEAEKLLIEYLEEKALV